MREKLTVIIPAKNEEKNIRDCLESVKWADEIFFVDSFSTDKTIEIAKKYTDRIVQREYKSSADQLNWAIPQASHKWILFLEADERVSPELKSEIIEVLENKGFGYDGFKIRRQNYFLGKKINYCGWQRDYVTKLFKKDKGKKEYKHVHSDVKVQGKVGKLKGKLIHYPYNNLTQYFNKFNRYTSWSALDLYEANRKPSILKLILNPLWRFFRMYILQLGFLDGIHGFILCTLASISVFTKYAKLWELHLKQKND